MHVSETHIAAAPAVGQLLVINPELVQDRGPQVIHRGDIHRSLVAKLIRRTMHAPPLDPATGQPHAETEGVVIAPI